MTKKILDIEAITNELEGASLFFSKPKAKEAPIPVEIDTTPPSDRTSNKSAQPRKIKVIQKPKEVSPNNPDDMQPLHHDTTVSRYEDVTIEVIRKAVKDLGKEAATHRFTQEEKRSISDIIYTYKTSGIKTSENEIARIAINFLIQDYKENGENSILEKVLNALNN